MLTNKSHEVASNASLRYIQEDDLGNAMPSNAAGKGLRETTYHPLCLNPAAAVSILNTKQSASASQTLNHHQRSLKDELTFGCICILNTYQ